jgi:hypothetical protein
LVVYRNPRIEALAKQFAMAHKVEGLEKERKLKSFSTPNHIEFLLSSIVIRITTKKGDCIAYKHSILYPKQFRLMIRYGIMLPKNQDPSYMID